MAAILAVDDSTSLRQMVAFTLKSSGFEVIEAVDGQDALDKLRDRSVDLVSRLLRCEGDSSTRGRCGGDLRRRLAYLSAQRAGCTSALGG